MDIGKLRHRVSFQTPTASVSASSFPTESAGSATVLWSQIEPITGRENFDGAGLTGKITHRIITRHQPGLTINNTTIATFESRTFNILHRRDIGERNIMWEMFAEERTGE